MRTRSSLYVNGSRAYNRAETEDDWGIRGYAGLTLSVALCDWLEVSVGAEGRFPRRHIDYNDGVTSGEVQLADWDLNGALVITF